jgi:hypothetical protein
VLLRRLAPLAAVALVVVPAARADADPASDILYTQRIYLPFFGGKVSTDRSQALKQVVDAAWTKGYKVKVALIATDQDLGGVYQMFGQPQQYADFLGQELVFLYKGLLVTVMPQGFGAFHYKKSVAQEQAVLKTIPIPQGTDGLADAATVAVSKLAGVKAPPIRLQSSSSSSGGTPAWMLAVIVAGGLALLGGMLAFGAVAVRRKRTA